MPDDKDKREKKFQLWGWIAFILCAVFFIASSIVHFDLYGLVGSIIFLLACVIFIIPLIERKK